MATRTITYMQDDLDGTEGAQPVSFSWQGKNYEIDLTPEHEEELRQLLSSYISNGRRVGRSQPARRPGSTPTDRAQTAAIRRWATEQGMDVPARGRIPRHIREAYENAGR